MPQRLYRSRTNRTLLGVCGGIAEYLNVDPTLIRLGWAIITLFPPLTFFGIAAYVLATLIIPESPLE